jgi:NAD(P)-dependent dehydrogenase (short-subunit alcohol dehydrogenase family)
MTITLITGANKGLGYETAKRLVDLGHTVLAGARDGRRGTDAARELGATFLHIDPTDDGSVEAAAARVRDEYGYLDVLINSAGTAAPRLGVEELTAGAAMEGFAVNVFGPIRVTHAFLPLLRAADHPRIVNVSSGAGSFHRILDPGTVENAVTLPVYPATRGSADHADGAVDAGAAGHPGERGRSRPHRHDRPPGDPATGRAEGHVPGPTWPRPLVDKEQNQRCGAHPNAAEKQ